MAVTLEDPTLDPHVDLFSLPTERLEAAIVALAAQASTTRHRLLKLLAAYDRRGAWAAWGATSCAAWWAEVAQIEPSTAREHLRVARALHELPALDAALAEGRLSYAKIKAISRIADEETVEELIRVASPCPAGRLGIVLAAWAAGRMAGDAMAEAHHQARRVSYRVEPDGMVTTIIHQPPGEGAALHAAIDRLAMADDAPAGASLAQLRADAVARLVAGASPAGTGPEVVVHVHQREDGDIVATLPDGTPVPEPEVTEILCEATVRAVVHDSVGRPVDASPARPGPTRRQRLVLEARDRRCQFRGCQATTFLHAHHVIPRERGGPTVLSNLVLLCSFHHRLLHRRQRGWRPDWWSERQEAEVRRRQRSGSSAGGGGDGIRTHDLRLAKPPL